MRTPVRHPITMTGLILVLVAGCEQSPTATALSDEIRIEKSLSQGATGAPAAIPFSVSFRDDDPCTNTVDPEEHMVTISGTAFVQELPNGNVVTRYERTTTTDSGYEGRGEATEVSNGNVLQLHWNDILTHPDGRMIRARLILVLDLRASPPSIRVLKGTVLCVRGG